MNQGVAVFAALFLYLSNLPLSGVFEEKGYYAGFYHLV